MNILSVTNVKYLGGFIMLCTFNTGVKKQVDMKPLLEYPAYSELNDEQEFCRFGLDGTLFWGNGADIAPEWLWENGVEVDRI